MEIVENVVQILTSLIYPLGLLLVFFLSQMYVVFFFVYSGNLWSFSLSAMAISDELGTLSPGFESEILGF